jgi:hypothetical protein
VSPALLCSCVSASFFHHFISSPPFRFVPLIGVQLCLKTYLAQLSTKTPVCQKALFGSQTSANDFHGLLSDILLVLQQQHTRQVAAAAAAAAAAAVAAAAAAAVAAADAIAAADAGVAAAVDAADAGVATAQAQSPRAAIPVAAASSVIPGPPSVIRKRTRRFADSDVI